MRTLRRLLLLLGAGAATASLVGVMTFALFTSQANPQTDTFATGTVTLAQDAESQLCTVTNMEPGDSTSTSRFPGSTPVDTPCSYQVDYKGSIAAWIALDVTTSSTAGIGGNALMDGRSDGLQAIITDSFGNMVNVNQMSLGTFNCVGTFPNESSCQSSAKNQFLKQTSATGYTGALVNKDGSVNNGWSDTFSVNYELPLDAPNPYQGGSAYITLTAHAVQASNNPIITKPDGTLAPQNGWN